VAGRLISLAEARQLVLAEARPLPAEDVPVGDALGRVLAEEVTSAHDLPPFDSSAMDGFAVVAGPGGELPIVGESRAGQPSDRPLGRGEAIRISTGAEMPTGADAVVPVERTSSADGRVVVPDTEAGANVRRAGEDVRAGTPVLGAGVELGPAEVAVLTSLGREAVRCGARPRAAIVVTGSAAFGRWVVWTVAGKDFVCLEPWTAAANALNTGDKLLTLARGKSTTETVTVALARAR